MSEVRTPSAAPSDLAQQLEQLAAQFRRLRELDESDYQRHLGYTCRFASQLLPRLQQVIKNHAPEPARSAASRAPGKRALAPAISVQSDFLMFKEAMSYLRVSRSTLYRLLRSGQLTGQKVSNTWRFTREALDACVIPVSSEGDVRGERSAP